MYDFIIVGGGIVGLSTGLALIRRNPKTKLLILEKEGVLAFHQTGHNSGVIHSGIYYKPGSLKARFSKEGSRKLIEFCEKHDIDFEICGKVIVATEKEELPLLQNLYKRGLDNGLNIAMIDKHELQSIEPHVNGLAAIHVKSAGIVDYQKVANKFAELIQENGGEIQLNCRVENIEETSDTVVVECANNKTFKARYLINCAGLHSDRIAQLNGLTTGMKIIPFRGEYYKLKPEKKYLVKNLIYPVPNPKFPFLGVHFTRMIDGEIHAGPNAVLSFKREGYKKSDFNLKDVAEMLTYPAFWKMASKNMREGLKEIVRSFSKTVFVRSLQRLIPEIREKDVVPAGSGVRAQALTKDGKLIDDFFIVSNKRSIHILNAPSPAATASISIGQAIVEKIPERDEMVI
jgi:L-2-hydroxyglutarate oxidase